MRTMGFLSLLYGSYPEREVKGGVSDHPCFLVFLHRRDEKSDPNHPCKRLQPPTPHPTPPQQAMPI